MCKETQLDASVGKVLLLIKGHHSRTVKSSKPSFSSKPCIFGWYISVTNKNSNPNIPVLWCGHTINHAINGLKYQWGATP